MKKISSYSKCSLLLVLALLSGIFSGLAQDAKKKVAVYAVAFKIYLIPSTIRKRTTSSFCPTAHTGGRV